MGTLHITAPDCFMGVGAKINVYLQKDKDEKVAVLKSGENTTVEITDDCYFRVAMNVGGLIPPKKIYLLSCMDTVAKINYNRLWGTLSVELVSETPIEGYVLEDVTEEDFETEEDIEDTIEHRMRCNVCGHIFCYTDEDLKENFKNAGMGVLSSLGGLASTLGGGTIFHTQHLTGQANRNTDKIIDYSRCPSCNSSDISEIKDAENSQQSNNIQSSTSSIEEIKNYKELLDIGIITQEEFDQKKKQLLDL